MELGSTWDATSRLDTQEFPKVLWNPKVHYRVHNSQPLVPNLGQIYPVLNTIFYYSKIRFIIIFPATSVSS
jgi:hypothetical protein